ncbi:unnamed protein product [Ectocarpus sp. 6 AP-2014]
MFNGPSVWVGATHTHTHLPASSLLLLLPSSPHAHHFSTGTDQRGTPGLSGGQEDCGPHHTA